MELTDEQKRIMKGEICPYCKQPSEYLDSSVVYGESYGMIYLCRRCDAWVGVHKRWPKRAKGRLANSELRHYKKLTHDLFDPLWQTGIFESRGDAYGWLSDFTGLPPEYTHIGMFGVETCKKNRSLPDQPY
jgi:hypothetical protein